MAESIVCPVCGETNPGDMEFCRNCQSRLRPLTGALKGENAPIQPGEVPTKKVTSELEPLLPQWLRDARQQARDTAAEDASRAEQAQKETPASSAPDLLDGLASQRDDDEDVPDWLAQITGAKSKKKKQASEDNQVKWVELGRDRGQPPLEPPAETTPETPAPGPRPSERDDLTDWFKQAAASSETADFRMPPAPLEATPAPEMPESAAAVPQRPAEDLSWLKNLQADSAIPPEATAQTSPLPRDEVPDWLRKLEADQQAAPPDMQQPARTAPLPPADVPGWLSQFEGQAPPVESAAQAPQPAEQAIPDWLRGLPSEASSIQPPQPEAKAQEPAIPAELPDWLSSLPSRQATPQTPEPEPPTQEPVISTDQPDWISALPSQQSAQQPEPTPEEPAISAGLPDWISSLPSQEEPQSPSAQPAPDEALFSTEMPDWLSSLPAQLEASQPAEPQPAAQETIKAGQLPDWISDLGSAQPPSAQPPEAPARESAPRGVPPESLAQEAPAQGTAVKSGALAGEDVEAVFASMQTPDWLSAVLPAAEAPEAQSAPAAEEIEEPIGPAELPSWVQAMRPVESAMAAAGAAEDVGTEKRGPLAGLHGVLPTVPGAAEPSSKPKSYSIKLSANEQQLAHAALLERILAAETAPIPMKVGGLLRSERLLRWILSALLFLALGGIVFGGTQIFALPTGVPNETVAAIRAVESIPADAPVLLVFDYQPSTVGEMEAAGGPLLDHLLLLNPPRLAFLSTSPTGPALAERFMSRVLSTRGALIPDQQYVNLGYLPGGLAGIYNFAQNPVATMPLDTQRRPAWQSSFLAPVRSLSDFAAIIVLTDSVESGRSWIEQTELARGKSTLVLVASAQAGPMLLPYVDSAQVNGMVSGIYGAVGVEQRNAGSPACTGRPDSVGAGAANSPSCVRRYWDAYSAGLYLAVALITLGALWNLGLAMRERRAQGAG